MARARNNALRNGLRVAGQLTRSLFFARAHPFIEEMLGRRRGLLSPSNDKNIFSRGARSVDTRARARIASRLNQSPSSRFAASSEEMLRNRNRQGGTLNRVSCGSLGRSALAHAPLTETRAGDRGEREADRADVRRGMPTRHPQRSLQTRKSAVAARRQSVECLAGRRAYAASRVPSLPLVAQRCPPIIVAVPRRSS